VKKNVNLGNETLDKLKINPLESITNKVHQANERISRTET
jgi:hypothetical protein